MPESIRLAAIGLGKIARDQHLPAIAADRAFSLVATVDPGNALPGMPGFPSLAALLADGPGIDAVAICTPPQIREAIAIEALRAGLHVMLEKPPAGTLSGVARLVAAAAQGQTLFAAWHSREAPMVAQARAWLAGRTIRRGTIRWREDARIWHPGQHWLWEPGGLGVFDPAINAFSILTAISAEIFSVRDAQFEIPADRHTPVAATGTLVSDAGTIALDLDFRESGAPCWDIELEMFDGGRLVLSDGGRRLRLDGAGAQTAPDAEYPALYRRFAQLIADGASDMDTAALRLVADAFLVARTTRGPPYDV
jgi:D-galactose 1-dehydrogenase